MCFDYCKITIHHREKCSVTRIKAMLIKNISKNYKNKLDIRDFILYNIITKFCVERRRSDRVFGQKSENGTRAVTWLR